MKILAYPISNPHNPRLGKVIDASIHPNGKTGIASIQIDGIEATAWLITRHGESRWVY